VAHEDAALGGVDDGVEAQIVAADEQRRGHVLDRETDVPPALGSAGWLHILRYGVTPITLSAVMPWLGFDRRSTEGKGRE
jgi:hypothetical protein